MRVERTFTLTTAEKFAVEIDKKYSLIGEGCYAKIYSTLSRKTVLKFVDGCFDGCFDGYLAYIKIALKHQDNPWFPKIKSATIYDYFTVDGDLDSYFVVEMERLEKAADAHPFIGECCLNDSRQFFRLVMSNLKMKGKSLKFFNQAKRQIQRLVASHEDDLHSGNVMARGKQLVITDPVVD